MKHAREDYNRIQDPENRIPEDEPVFLLRGQDKIAPQLLVEWANLLEAMGGDESMANKARNHAMEMLKWQRDKKMKVPDEPYKNYRPKPINVEDDYPEPQEEPVYVKPSKEGLQMKYFVLKPEGSDIYAKASRRAITAYANLVYAENRQMASDLLSWVADAEKEAYE